MMTDCIFCKIIQGEIPCHKVYEDENFLAFLDISPVNNGHTLVIPKKHYETVPKADDNDLREIMIVIKKVAVALLEATEADGFNIMQSNGKMAGQDVFHVHFHIIPRFADDDKKFNWTHQKYKEGEMKHLSEKIRASLV